MINLSLDTKEKPLKKKKVISKTKSSKKMKSKVRAKKPKTPLVVVKKKPTKEEIERWLRTAPGYIQGLSELYGDQTVLYDYQIDYMLDKSDFIVVNKSRQVGLSFVIAAKALAKAYLEDTYRSIFISINREEASNKINYARELYDSIPLAWKKKKIVDNKFSLEFQSHNGKTRSNLVSLAQRAPRGPGYNTDVFLDEFAHFQWAREIYTAALPIVSRGDATLSILSTPFGNKGQFYDVCSDRDSFSEFSVYEIPWWDCSEFCVDVVKAKTQAPKLGTVERIRKYAKPRLKQIYKSMDLMDFQQEYECAFVDEATAYFPLSLIQQCLFTYEDDDWMVDLEEYAEDKKKYALEQKYPKINLKCYNDLDAFLSAVQKGTVGRELYAGYDVGRKIDSAELVIIEEVRVGPILLKIVRLMVQFKDMKFKQQEHILDELVRLGILHNLLIDSTGMGSHLGENLEDKHYGVVTAVDFTNKFKSKIAKKTKICLENQILALPDNHALIKQIHSIRRTITENSHERYEVDKTQKHGHHADKLWAMALAVEAGNDPIVENYEGEVYAVSESRVFLPLTGGKKVGLTPPGEFNPKVDSVNYNIAGVDVISDLTVPSDIMDLDIKIKKVI